MSRPAILLLTLATLCGSAELRADDTTAPAPQKFVTVNAHIMGGASYTTNNYMSCFPEISDINSSMGPLFGVGVEGVCSLGRHFSVGTGINLTRNQRRMDIAVSGAGKPSVSNVFQRNIYYELDFPVYLRWEFAIAKGVDWNVDGGLYYSYGVWGNQKNTIYDAKTNDLGQLMTSKSTLETGYYSDDRAFINSYRRGDVGVHLATGLTFRNHLTVGIRTHLGMKDVSRSTGIVNPSAHNINLQALIGWSF
ncbi:MAG: PorT family protein [Muribaculaceae bacterium]|nr:PorT family protein [Muribaculaceae bacterium]